MCLMRATLYTLPTYIHINPIRGLWVEHHAAIARLGLQHEIVLHVREISVTVGSGY